MPPMFDMSPQARAALRERRAKMSPAEMQRAYLADLRASSAASSASSSASASSSPAAAGSLRARFGRMRWFVAGVVLRAPAVGGAKMLGARLLLSSGPLKLVGGFLVGLCALIELERNPGVDDDPDGSRPQVCGRACAVTDPALIVSPLPRHLPCSSTTFPSLAATARLPSHYEPLPLSPCPLPLPPPWQVPLEPTPLPRVALLRDRLVPIPRSWSHTKGRTEAEIEADVSCHRVKASERLRRAIENGMHATAHASCVGVDGTGHTRRASVVSVHRVENLALWKQYVHRKREVTDRHHAHRVRAQPLEPLVSPIAMAADRSNLLDEDRLLEPRLNECFLYHGTPAEVADIITEHGFDERVAALSGLYGAGVYFASQSCKSAQYAKDEGIKTLLIARVALGDPFYASGTELRQARRPPERSSAFSRGLTYDSVVANRGGTQAHREFIVYDHRDACMCQAEPLWIELTSSPTPSPTRPTLFDPSRAPDPEYIVKYKPG